jgi:Fur family transcriptional regulator, ferric uptake regulator
MIRSTQQRKAIYDVLIDSGRPLSVNEIFEQAKNGAPTLGIATVYRNIKALQDEGKLNLVALPGESPRWEVPTEHHHHFLCRTCDRLFEIRNCPTNIGSLLPDGYVLEDHDILLRGQCRDCAKRKSLKSDK